MPVACQLLVTGKLIFLHLQSSSYVHLITRVTSNEASPLPGAKLHETSRQTQPKATIAQDSETTGDLLALLPVLNRHLVTLPARLSPFTKRLITKFHGKMRKGLWAYDINISIHIIVLILLFYNYDFNGPICLHDKLALILLGSEQSINNK